MHHARKQRSRSRCRVAKRPSPRPSCPAAQLHAADGVRAQQAVVDDARVVHRHVGAAARGVALTGDQGALAVDWAAAGPTRGGPPVVGPPR
jgi:hypothetical protein